jgi:hypothetical protein
MSKNTIMVLAVIVALLTGWLVLELASKSSTEAPTNGSTTSGGQTTTMDSGYSAESGSPANVSTKVEIKSPTTTTVEVR